MPASSAEPAVRLCSVTVEYPIDRERRSVRALSDVTLEVARGERVALLGESGAGKSTLLDIVSGLIAPTSGDVEVLGVAPGSLRSRELRRHRSQIGVIRQAHGLPPALRVVHNVNGGRLGTWSTARALTSLVRPRDRAEVDAALQRVGLEGLAGRVTGELSGGQQQRVAVARAVIEPRRLVVADEPVSAVDPKLSDDVVGLLTERSEERAVLVSLHDPSLARRHVDRVVGLRDGRVMFDLAADAVSDRRLDELYRATPHR